MNKDKKLIQVFKKIEKLIKKSYKTYKKGDFINFNDEIYEIIGKKNYQLLVLPIKFEKSIDPGLDIFMTIRICPLFCKKIKSKRLIKVLYK